MNDSELVSAFQNELESNGVHCEIRELQSLIPIIKPRINFIHEVWEQSWFFFKAPSSYDPGVISKRWKDDTPEKMNLLAGALQDCEPFTTESVESVVKDLIQQNQWGMGVIMNAWRLLLVGEAMGPGLFDLAAFIGKEEVLIRMKNGTEQINNEL
jgi:glutamyl-tRNA synthetase